MAREKVIKLSLVDPLKPTATSLQGAHVVTADAVWSWNEIPAVATAYAATAPAGGWPVPGWVKEFDFGSEKLKSDLKAMVAAAHNWGDFETAIAAW